MQDKLFTYSDEIDQAFSVLESTLELELARCEMAYEYADKLYDVKVKEADLRVMNESGSYDDLASMYEDAATQTNEKKQGVVSTIFTAIKNFISSIFEKIASLFKGKDEKAVEDAINQNPGVTVETDGDPVKTASAITNAWNQIKKFCAPGFTKDNGNGERVFSITRTLTTTLAAVGIGFLAKKGGSKVKKKAGDIFKTFKTSKNIESEIQDGIKSVENSNMDPESKKTLAKALSDMAHSAGTVTMGCLSSLKGFLGKPFKKAYGKLPANVQSILNNSRDKNDFIKRMKKENPQMTDDAIKELANETFGADGVKKQLGDLAKKKAINTAAKAMNAVDNAREGVRQSAKNAKDMKTIVDSLVASGYSQADAEKEAKAQLGIFESTYDYSDLDDLYDEMDCLESADYDESCDDILALISSL